MAFSLKDFASGIPTLEGVADGAAGYNVQRVLDGISGAADKAGAVINAFGTDKNGAPRLEPIAASAQVNSAPGAGVPWGIIAAVAAVIALVYFLVLKK